MGVDTYFNPPDGVPKQVTLFVPEATEQYNLGIDITIGYDRPHGTFYIASAVTNEKIALNTEEAEKVLDYLQGKRPKTVWL